MKQNLLKVLFLSVILIASLTVNAGRFNDSIPVKKRNNMAYNGYQGGMMLHMGYAGNFSDKGTNPIKMEGVALGIGGAVRVKFGKYLRVGSEGYVTTLKYDKKHSYAKVGWGGILLDSHWIYKRWTFFAGGSIGGGGYTHIHMNTTPDEDKLLGENDILYTKYPFMVVDPFVGFEYNFTKRIGFVVKLDYLLNVTRPYDDYVTGPRLFIGLMFGH